jgi:hypothetical protein
VDNTLATAASRLQTRSMHFSQNPSAHLLRAHAGSACTAAAAATITSCPAPRPQASPSPSTITTALGRRCLQHVTSIAGKLAAAAIHALRNVFVFGTTDDC